jgi:hypothetical protein
VGYSSSQGVGSERAGDPRVGKKVKETIPFLASIRGPIRPAFGYFIYLPRFIFTHPKVQKGFTVSFDPWTRDTIYAISIDSYSEYLR